MNENQDDKRNAALTQLFDEVEARMAKVGIPQELRDSFVRDGFYPGYSAQPIRVLFVGRESLSTWGNYTERMYEMYLANQIGSATLDQYQFHALLFYVAYGFNHGFPDWENIPPASELAQRMEDPKTGVSFGLINLSKFSNWNQTDWSADWNLIEKSIEVARDADGSILTKEIGILDPHVICSMNFAAYLEDIAEHSDLVPFPAELEAVSKNVKLYRMAFAGKTYPVLDMWHFSAPGKSWKNDYYEPLRKLWPFLKGQLDV